MTPRSRQPIWGSSSLSLWHYTDLHLHLPFTARDIWLIQLPPCCYWWYGLSYFIPSHLSYVGAHNAQNTIGLAEGMDEFQINFRVIGRRTGKRGDNKAWNKELRRAHRNLTIPHHFQMSCVHINHIPMTMRSTGKCTHALTCASVTSSQNTDTDNMLV